MGQCTMNYITLAAQGCERREAPGPNAVPFAAGRYGDADGFALTAIGEAYLSAQEPGAVAW
jgi:hypothetical protein